MTDSRPHQRANSYKGQTDVQSYWQISFHLANKYVYVCKTLKRDKDMIFGGSVSRLDGNMSNAGSEGGGLNT